MDEFERDEISEELMAEEEILEEEMLEEEITAEPLEEEQPEEQPPPAKPDKPIKGPRFWAWSVAVLLMLFGLVLTVPAAWNLMLGVPAVAGLVSEAGRRYESAGRAYELLAQMDMGSQGMGLSALGLSSGNFYYERQYALTAKRDGPLAILQSEELPPISQVFPARVPRGLRRLAAQCDALAEVYEGVSAQLDLLLMPGEQPDESEWQEMLLTAIEAAKALDGKAEANAIYYETIILQVTAADPEQKQASQERIAALKKDPAGAFWMYEAAERYLAIKDEDYDAVAALCAARLKRNRQDFQAMRDRVKAFYFSGGEAAAFKEADKYAKRAEAKEAMQMAKAEIYYRQGKYDEAIALCDAILDKADFDAPAATPAEETALRGAMEAASVKSTVLLLQGRPGEAIDLLQAARGNPYLLLAAYIAGGEWESEETQNLVMMLNYYGYPVPQAITDLSEGRTTIEKIFTEGWGGFDA